MSEEVPEVEEISEYCRLVPNDPDCYIPPEAEAEIFGCGPDNPDTVNCITYTQISFDTTLDLMSLRS